MMVVEVIPLAVTCVAIIGVIQKICHSGGKGVRSVASHFIQVVIVLLCHEDTGVLISMRGRV